ncbi:putative Zinc finger protein [Tripterygium wilfordii]|uniref:Putative Zinc finger protein n=1 Tax=Tripterygium wilfordii TaxID=458696 RepID=A0A7J7DYS2_TRIWF|nr:putative Zinc finger protein [Tripterygium wilfordii]
MAEVNAHMQYLRLYAVLLLCSTSLIRASGGSPLERRTSALFIFGDSTVDPGNNNYIKTIPENQANFKPYGHNGFFEGPTGRFSDGRVIIDYIAEYAELPLIPPFLQPSADYSNGVNFASGGSGVLPETNFGLVIDLPTQLRNFEEVQKSLTKKLGEEKAKEVIAEAVYFISIGSNDYIVGYLGNPKMQELHVPETYVGMVIGNLTQAVQFLYERGARKFGFLSLSPLGCLPALRALNPKGSEDGGCFEAASALAITHNKALKPVLATLEQILKGFKYSDSNFYDWLDDRISSHTKYGFKEGVNACCGTGPYGGISSCGGNRKVTEYKLCENSDEYIWWDVYHPTDRFHEQIAKALWNGPSSFVGPYNLEDLL